MLTRTYVLALNEIVEAFNLRALLQELTRIHTTNVRPFPTISLYGEWIETYVSVRTLSDPARELLELYGLHHLAILPESPNYELRDFDFYAFEPYDPKRKQLATPLKYSALESLLRSVVQTCDIATELLLAPKYQNIRVNESVLTFRFVDTDSDGISPKAVAETIESLNEIFVQLRRAFPDTLPAKIVFLDSGTDHNIGIKIDFDIANIFREIRATMEFASSGEKREYDGRTDSIDRLLQVIQRFQVAGGNQQIADQMLGEVARAISLQLQTLSAKGVILEPRNESIVTTVERHLARSRGDDVIRKLSPIK